MAQISTPYDDKRLPAGSPLMGSLGRHSDGETTAESINLAQLEFQHWNPQADATIEVPDSLPKKEYYTSLRRFAGMATTGRYGSISGGSALGINGTLGAYGGTLDGRGGMLSPVAAVGSPYPSGTIGRSQIGRSHASALNFKPSGKMVDCAVIMLDGLQQTFSIDKAAFGQQLFDAVCLYLDLLEGDFFGIKYYAPDNTTCWLRQDKKIMKQVGRNWQFEFQVKYYPYDIDSIEEDLTRYYLCLQVRQNLLSGQLPCSFSSYVILSSYVVQSDAGDYDTKQHQGIAYLRDHPFAPQHLQTQEMLKRIAQTHRQHYGQTPESADRNFLNNAKKMALYGVHMHKVKTLTNEDYGLGVFYGGLLLYLNRLRIQRFSWPRIIKLSYKKRNFSMVVRPLDSDQGERTLVFRCPSALYAKRLWKTCVDHHNFFRLRGYEKAKKPSVLPGFASRKYHYAGQPASGPSGDISPELLASRPQPVVRRIPAHRREVPLMEQDWFNPPYNGEVPYSSHPTASQFQHSQQAFADTMIQPTLPPDALAFQGYYEGGVPNGAPLVHPTTTSPRTGRMLSGDRVHWQPVDSRPRPAFKPEYWRISPADRTHGLGINMNGLDVAAEPGSGWQGCRANKGVKSPGTYYYEATVLEDGMVRVGWSTNGALLDLGEDKLGFAYGADTSASAGAGGLGKAFHNGESINYGTEVMKGDVVGCYLNLNTGTVFWSLNANVFDRGVRIPEASSNEAFFPAGALKDCRIIFNFGDQPFKYFPNDLQWLPVTQTAEEDQMANCISGWRMNPYDATASMDVSPDGTVVQSALGHGWQGCRSNKGVKGVGRFYFESQMSEAGGLARVGWVTADGQLRLGTDRFGFGYGADMDGFGLNGQQGKRMHNDEIDNYGEAFGEGDVVGCFLDTIEHVIKWAKNGVSFGDAYRLPTNLDAAFAPIMDSQQPVVFYPCVTLRDSTMEINFGNAPFKYYPGPDWKPVCCALAQNLQASGHLGPRVNRHKNRSRSYIESNAAASFTQMATPSVDRHEEDVAVISNTRATISKPPLMHLIGGVPMPGMVPANLSASPTRNVGDPGCRLSNGTSRPNGSLGRAVLPTTTGGSPTRVNVHVDSNGHVSPTATLSSLNGVNEVVVVERCEPQIESGCYVDENGKIIKRTVKRTKVVTTKTYSKRLLGASEPYTIVNDEHEQALDAALQFVTNLDPDATVLNNTFGTVQLRAYNPTTIV